MYPGHAVCGADTSSLRGLVDCVSSSAATIMHVFFIQQVLLMRL